MTMNILRVVAITTMVIIGADNVEATVAMGVVVTTEAVPDTSSQPCRDVCTTVRPSDH